MWQSNLLEQLSSACLHLTYLDLSFLTLAVTESHFTGKTFLQAELSSAREMTSGPPPCIPSSAQCKEMTEEAASVCSPGGPQSPLLVTWPRPQASANNSVTRAQVKCAETPVCVELVVTLC